MQRSATLLAFALLIATGLACGSNETANTQASGNNAATSGDASQSPGIKSVTLTNAAGETVTSFKSAETTQKAIVTLPSFGAAKVKAVFIAVGAGGEADTKILEKEVETGALTNTANFTLTLDQPFPVGDYKLEIYLNGKLAQTVNYKVQ